MTGSPSRIALPDRAADQHRLQLVEIPPVAAQAADRQQALVVAAERDERARADHARHLALPLGVHAALEQLGLEHEAARDRVAPALDRHRVALAHRAPLARAVHLRGSRRLLARADGREQRPMADQVGIAPDRRGEVAVARRAQSGVADVARRVVRLLERAQHQRREGGAAVPAPAHLAVHQMRDLRHQVGRLLRGHRLRARRGRHVERGQLVGEVLDARRLGPLVHAVERRQLARLKQRRHRLVGGDHQVLDQPVRLGLLARTPAR